MSLSRYHRQELLPGFGPDSAARLGAAHAMVIGCGALGTVAIELLARAGVGRISIIDRDVVELTNLQRQTLFDESDARAHRPKADAAARRLASINSSIAIEPLVEDFAGPAAERIVAAHPRPAVLLDCTDNFATRYLANDLAVKLSIPLCYGGAVGTRGMHMCILPGRTACLRCVFPEAPAPGDSPTCDTVGVLATVTSMVAAAQANAAIKILLGRADLLASELVSFDPWNNDHRRVRVADARRADCPCCAHRRFEFLDAPHTGATVLCGRNSVQISPAGRAAAFDLAAIGERLARLGPCERADRLVRFRPSHQPAALVSVPSGTPDGFEITVFDDGRAVVGGTSDPVLARALFDRFIGS